MIPRALSPCFAAFVALACGPTNLPDDQLLTSPHFRYHARADAVLDPTIMDRLEARRAEFDARFGVDPGIVDYYLFRDEADGAENSTCPAGLSCTDGRSVMTSAPLHEHELVHAFLHDVGLPAPVVAEGVAQYASCLYPRLSYPVAPEQWAEAVGTLTTGPFADGDVWSAYNFGQRLVSWMIATGGERRFLGFYGDAVPTADASLFALQFERFWGRRLGEVAVELLDPRFAGSSCPCTAPALPADGSSVSFAAFQDYRTLDVAQESRLELTNDGGQLVFPYVCANTLASGPDVPVDAASSSLTVARIGPGRYGVTTAPGPEGTAVVRQTLRAASDWTCDTAAAQPVALAGRNVTAWVTPALAGQVTWFAFTLDAPALLDILTPETDFLVCPSCHPGGFGGCVGTGPATADTIGIPVMGNVVIALSTSRATPAALGVRLRAAP